MSSKQQAEEILAGTIPVDAGMVMVMDPCYIVDTLVHAYNLGKNGGLTEDEEETAGLVGIDTVLWHKYLEDNHLMDMPHADNRLSGSVTLTHGNGVWDGLGVACNSGFGDGSYDVFVKIQDVPGWGRRVSELRVVFITDEDLEDEEGMDAES